MEGSARPSLEMLVPLVAVLKVETHQPLAFLNVTLAREVQPSNAYFPIEVTPLPIVTLAREVQP